jgi:hypothetical protein
MGTAGAVALITGLLLTSSSVAASARVPFELKIAGVGGFSSPSSVFFSGSGSAWHMGEVTDAGTATDFSPATTCPQGGINNVHTETFTAADGSTLTVVSADVACWEGPALLHCATCPWTVRAGTGRFAAARGTGNLDGYLDLATGSFWGTYTGTITE